MVIHAGPLMGKTACGMASAMWKKEALTGYWYYVTCIPCQKKAPQGAQEANRAHWEALQRSGGPECQDEEAERW